ncbi:uncharacterized protein LOC131215576 [Anopheles bellator]|uniref:uncharacterized protein LOC131215576 n=1 Tax=Anopheles bellator TaxID=139047 RepID=UPI002647834B|nr:uncharacterized protein LOC131215576 [Anopheles bellator]
MPEFSSGALLSKHALLWLPRRRRDRDRNEAVVERKAYYSRIVANEMIVNSASDLLLLGAEVRTVPLSRIAQVTLGELRRHESDVELYEFLFTNVIHHFEPEQFEEEISVPVLPELVHFLDKLQSDLLSSALSCFFAENHALLQRLMAMLQNLLEYTASHANTFHLYHSLVIFPEYLLRCYTILRSSADMSSAQDTELLNAKKTLYRGCNNILTVFLELLCPEGATSSYFQKIDQDKQFECLEKVCLLLAAVGNEISDINAQLASNVWTSITKLCTKHAEQCFTRNRSDWLSQIVLTLNAGLEASFLELCVKNKPPKALTLRTNEFFLRIMSKLLSLSKQHASLDGFLAIITTLLRIKTCLHSRTVARELATGIDQYLHVGYIKVVENSIRLESFAKALAQYECQTVDDIHSFYILTMHVIEQIIINSNDLNLLKLYCVRGNLLQQVCTLLKRSDNLFLANENLYQQLLVRCSALAVMGARLRNRVVHKAIEESMVRMILQEHYYTGLFGIDLWSVFVRCHTTQLMFAYFTFWEAINGQYAIFSTKPEQVYVATVLRNLFDFLPVAMKVNILCTRPISDCANDRLWATVRLPDEVNASHKKCFVDGIAKRLQTVTNTQQPSVKRFYEMLHLIRIVGNTGQTADGALGECVKQFCKQIDWSNILTKSDTIQGNILECMQENLHQLPAKTLCGGNLSSASVFVKYKIMKLWKRTNTPLDAAEGLKCLLNDNEPFINAQAFFLLRTLNDRRHPVAVQLIAKTPSLQSQLLFLSKDDRRPVSSAISNSPGHCVAVAHRCKDPRNQGTDSPGDLTQLINDKIDQLFPDEDGDDIDMLVANLPPKRRKVEENDGRAKANRFIDQLEVQTEELGQLLRTHRLEVANKERLRKIVSAVTNILES